MAYPNDPPAPPTLALKSGESINTGLVGWWPLTETDDYASGAADISGNSYDLTKTGTATSGFTEIGTAPLFDGSTGYLRRAQDLSSHSTGVGTVSLWWRLDSAALDNPSDCLFYMGDENTSYRLIVNAGRVGSSAPNASIWFFSSSNGTPQNLLGMYDNGAHWAFDDTWHHFAYVVTTTSNHMYIDGSEITQAYYPSYGSSSTGNVFLHNASGFDAIRIGSQKVSSTESAYVQGSVQNVRIWNVALTAQQVSDIYTTPWLGSNYEALGNTYFFPAHFGGRL